MEPTSRVGGVAAFAVVRLVGPVSNLALLHRVGFDLPVPARYHPGPELIGQWIRVLPAERRILLPTGMAGELALPIRWASWAPIRRRRASSPSERPQGNALGPSPP